MWRGKAFARSAGRCGAAGNLIRQALEDAEPKGYQQKAARQTLVLGSNHARIEELLKESERLPRKQRCAAHKIYQLVQAEGYRDCESNVHTQRSSCSSALLYPLLSEQNFITCSLRKMKMGSFSIIKWSLFR